MASIEVTFINGGDSSELDAEVDNQQTREQVLQSLIEANFIPALNDANRHYTLTVKGKSAIAEGQSLATANVATGDQIRVAVAQTAGGTNNHYSHFHRLITDYESMQKLTGSTILWRPQPPFDIPNSYPIKYLLTFNILAPTIDGNRTSHIVEIDCSSLDYPFHIPIATFQTPVIKHPHVYSDGSKRICLGGFPLDESLGELCIRIAKLFQFDETLINTDSIASKEFWDWYTKNKQRLPLDKSVLPIFEDNVNSGFIIKKRRMKI